MHANGRGIDKLPTIIAGFDYISCGGIPKNRDTLIAGAGKSLLVLQFSAQRHRAASRRRDAGHAGRASGRPDRQVESRLAVVDTCVDTYEYAMVNGEFDLSGLTARIEHAVGKVQARHLALGCFPCFVTLVSWGRELQRPVTVLRQGEVTAIITVERTAEDKVARFDVEEFVADNIIMLRNRPEEERRRTRRHAARVDYPQDARLYA